VREAPVAPAGAPGPVPPAPGAPEAAAGRRSPPEAGDDDGPSRREPPLPKRPRRAEGGDPGRVSPIRGRSDGSAGSSPGRSGPDPDTGPCPPVAVVRAVLSEPALSVGWSATGSDPLVRERLRPPREPRRRRVRVPAPAGPSGPSEEEAPATPAASAGSELLGSVGELTGRSDGCGAEPRGSDAGRRGSIASSPGSRTGSVMAGFPSHDARSLACGASVAPTGRGSQRAPSRSIH
jgi:hypothetical protein